MFYIDEAGKYVRGPVFIAFYIIAVIYIVYGLLKVFSSWRIFDLGRWLALFSGIGFMVIAMFVQFFYPGLRVEMFAGALALLFILMMVQKPEEMIDIETGLLTLTAFKNLMFRSEKRNKLKKLIVFSATNYQKTHAKYTYEQEMEYVKRNYPRYPNVALDYAILEQSEDVYVMKCDFGWADLGTWHGIYEAMQKTDGDNVVLDSEVILEDCSDNIIKLPKGRLGVINGLEGYIVAEQDNVLLICKKGDSSALVRKYVSEVQIKYGEEFV
jgi:hypothetical protein